MTRESDAAALRREILAKVREYHSLAFPPKGAFVPDETSVPYAGRVFDEQEMANLVDSALDFWLTYGRYSRSFEQGLGAYLGVKYAYLVNSGSSANLLAFAALMSDQLGDKRIRPGDEVITVAAAFPTTVAPIVQLGAVPVFVDIELDTGNADASQLEGALSHRTKAVMLAHTLGNPFDVDAVHGFCERHGLWLIEDNCDALGAEYRQRKTGTFGHIGTSSFYPPHHMTTGEGGAVYTDDDELAAIMLSMRDWGRDCWCPPGRDDTCGKRFSQQFGALPFGYDHKYVYSEFGFNLKASDMQAAVGVAQIEKLPAFVEARRRNHAFLHRALEPLADVLALPRATSGSDPSWFGYLMTVREDAPVSRADIIRALEGRKVQTRMLFAGNMVRQPAFNRMRETGEGYRSVGGLPNTDRAMTDSFWVGVYPGMSEDMLAMIAETITSAVRR
jgi:CDP-4-dehydro-6-deoxyglucose reductase, E1